MEHEYPFHTAFLLLLMLITGARLYFSGLADGASGVKQNTQGEGAFKIIRIVLGIPIAIAYLAYMIWPPSMQWSQIALPAEARWAGAALMFLTGIFLIWIQTHLSRNFTGTVQIRPGGHVVRTGPYAYVRHPMYWAFLLLGLGIFLLTANWLLGGGMILVILIVMIIRTPVEERALIEAYGHEYQEYMETTGRFFPRLRAFRKK